MIKALVTMIFLMISQYHHSHISSSRNLLTSESELILESELIGSVDNLDILIEQIIYSCNTNSKEYSKRNMKPTDVFSTSQFNPEVPLKQFVEQVITEARKATTTQTIFPDYVHLLDAYIYIEKYVTASNKRSRKPSSSTTWETIYSMLQTALLLSFKTRYGANSEYGMNTDLNQLQTMKEVIQNTEISEEELQVYKEMFAGEELRKKRSKKQLTVTKELRFANICENSMQDIFNYLVILNMNMEYDDEVLEGAAEDIKKRFSKEYTDFITLQNYFIPAIYRRQNIHKLSEGYNKRLLSTEFQNRFTEILSELNQVAPI